MFLLKRGSTYYLAFKNTEGKQIRVSTRCQRKSHALEFLRQFKMEQHTAESEKGRKHLSEFIREFIPRIVC